MATYNKLNDYKKGSIVQYTSIYPSPSIIKSEILVTNDHTITYFRAEIDRGDMCE